MSEDIERLLRCFLNANRVGIVASEGVIAHAQELVGRCPFCQFKIDDHLCMECPACERAIW